MYQGNLYDLISELLYKDNTIQIPVQGNCMAPTLISGKKVIIRPVRYPLSKGKIYVFIYCNNLYIHRLFKLKDGVAQLIGDRSRIGETVPAQAIIGEPVAHINSFSKNLISLTNSIVFSHRYKTPDVLRKVRIVVVGFILNIERWLYERKI